MLSTSKPRSISQRRQERWVSLTNPGAYCSRAPSGRRAADDDQAAHLLGVAWRREQVRSWRGNWAKCRLLASDRVHDRVLGPRTSAPCGYRG